MLAVEEIRREKSKSDWRWVKHSSKIEPQEYRKIPGSWNLRRQTLPLPRTAGSGLNYEPFQVHGGRIWRGLASFAQRILFLNIEGTSIHPRKKHRSLWYKSSECAD